MLDRAKIADDLLFGAEAIGKELQDLGVIEEDDENVESKVYYIAKTKKLPIGRFGKTLTASRTRLVNAVRALVA
jgi:hypothetical protein